MRAYTGPSALHPPSHGVLSTLHARAEGVTTAHQVSSGQHCPQSFGQWEALCQVKSVWGEKALPLKKKKVMENYISSV